MDNTQKSFPPSLIILLVILGGVLVLFIYTNRAKINPESQNVAVIISPAPTKIPTSIELTSVNPSATSVIGQPVVIQALADSNHQDVVGFDALVVYDQKAFSFLKAEPGDASYSVFAHLAPTHLSVTGVKKPTITSTNAFAKTPILSLTFTPKKTGTYVFTLTPRIQKETTKLVNGNSQIFIPTVQSVTVTIK